MIQSKTYRGVNSLNSFLSKTFSTVAVGVAISAVFAFISSKIVPIMMMRNPGLVTVISLLLIIGELAIAFYFSLNLNRMSERTALICYLLYSVVTGISFSTIIIYYKETTVTLAFVSTAIMFACMSYIGRTSDLKFSRVYAIFLPAIIAGVIITLLNVFIFHSTGLEMLIVYIGLILFLIITAADVQRLEDFYYSSNGNEELANKLVLLGAFQLYLDFANLFIKIIRIFGRRRDN